MQRISSKIRQAVRRYGYPVVSRYYRFRSPDHCPTRVLHFLNVADPSFRTDFQTLGRVTELAAPEGGLFAECGVYRGATLLGMAHILRKLHSPSYHIVGFDSFEGFPEPAKEDALPGGDYDPRTTKGFFGDTNYSSLKRRIAALGFESQITLVKGYFEDTLDSWKDKTFSVVHLDCDLYQSYMTCLNFFYPRIKPGGYIVFDEHDFIADIYPGAQRAIDTFLADKPEKLQRFEDAIKSRYFIVKKQEHSGKEDATEPVFRHAAQTSRRS